MFVPQISTPSKPPLLPPRMTKLYSSPFVQVSSVRWNAGASRIISVRQLDVLNVENTYSRPRQSRGQRS